KFNLSIDEDIADDVKEVKAVSGSKEIKAKKLSDGTYSFDHNDVLSRSLIGVNQQFDIKVVFNDDVDQTIKDDYKVDIAVLDREGKVVENTTDATYITSAESELPVEDSNKITASGLTLNPYEDEENELNLDYMMHYKTNANNIKDGQFQFALDTRLLEYVDEVLIENKRG